MIVKKILTASVWWPSDRPGAGLATGYSGQSNRAQMVRVVLSPSIPFRKRKGALAWARSEGLEPPTF